MSQNCLLIAGEKSGEEHALSFLSELKKLVPDLKLFGVGGDELQQHGMELLYHLKDFSSFGVSEVIGKIPFYFKALDHLEQEALKRNCKVAILIDFQDFNLRLAKRLNRHGIKVLYYVAPQAWAWKAGRAAVLQETVHTLFTILPFEKQWFFERGVDKVFSIPHPLTVHYGKSVQKVTPKPHQALTQKVKLLLLPGSRNDEVRFLLPEFKQVVKNLRATINQPIEVGLVRSSNVKSGHWDEIERVVDRQWKNENLEEALLWADLSLAASGTVTLATGLFQVPTVVAYKGSLLNQFIFETFVRYDRPVSLTNLVLEQRVFPEFLQESATAFNMTRALLKWIEDQKHYDTTKAMLAKLPNLLAGEGDPAPVMAQAFNTQGVSH